MTKHPLTIMENTPLIRTERLVLRRFADTEADVNAMFRILSDREVNRFLPWFPAQTPDDARAFLREGYRAFYTRASAYRYAICLAADNLPIGYIAVSDNESRDVGYAVRRDMWHKGIAAEAGVALAERLREAGFAYITATHDVENPRSGAVMKQMGMTYCYSYEEQWQPKNIPVVFRMYQRNFDGAKDRVFMEYWNMYPRHFVEEGV